MSSHCFANIAKLKWCSLWLRLKLLWTLYHLSCQYLCQTLTPNESRSQKAKCFLMTQHCRPGASICNNCRFRRTAWLQFRLQPPARHHRLTPSQKRYKTQIKSLVPKQRVLLERLFCNHDNIFVASLSDLKRTSLMCHRIEIGDSGPVRQPMPCVPHG